MCRLYSRETIGNLLQEQVNRQRKAAPHQDMRYTDTEVISRLRVTYYCLKRVFIQGKKSGKFSRSLPFELQ